MKTVIADKIASVAQDKALKRELRVSADIPCEEGVLVAVESTEQQGDLQQIGADQRPHGPGQTR